MLANADIKPPPRSKIHDTRMMHHPLESTYSTALKNLMARYVDPRAAAAQKDLEDGIKTYGWDKIPYNFQPYWVYAALDPVGTKLVKNAIYPRVQAECPKAYELELATSWITSDIERYGIHVDVAYAEEASRKFTDFVKESGDWVQEHYGVAAGSNPGVVRALNDEGFTWTKTTDSGAAALDKEILAGIDHPLAWTVLKRRQLQKLDRTYLRHFLDWRDADDLVHCSINSVGARTGRMSVQHPALQTLPRRSERNQAAITVRNCISARPGHTLLMCDFDQIEMRILAYLSKDPGMLAAFLSSDDFFVELARGVYADTTLQKSDPRRQTTKNAGYACVPLSTEILTQDGWKTHDQVRVGDLTIGYNFKTQKSEWTPVTQVVRYESAPTVRIFNKQRSLVTTPNHRWVADHEGNHREKFITTEDLLHSSYRLKLAAPSSVGGVGIPLTEQEIRILGWAMGDGRIEQGSYVGAPAQAGGRKVKCLMSIDQCKPRFVSEIDELTSGVPLRRYVAKHPTISGYHCVTWALNPDWARGVLQRAGLWQRDFDAWKFACTLSSHQREILVESLHAAEGNESDVTVKRVTMAQADDSPYKDLMIALGYLTGHFVRVRRRSFDTETGWTRKQCVSVAYQKPVMTGQRTTKIVQLEDQPVWCVQTGLGTWTMRQDGDTPILTGNTIYGAGLTKFALTAGITELEAKAFMQRWNEMYPGIAKFQREVNSVSMQRRHQEGEAYVLSPLTGRRHIAEPRKEYALVNYLIQGLAAEIFKMKVIEADAAGLGQWMTMLVHDEIVLDVPNEHVPEAVHTLSRVMNDNDVINPVPVSASVSFGHRWGEKDEWNLDAWRALHHAA